MKTLDNNEFEKHSAEAREKWGGSDAYKEHEERTKGYSGQKWKALAGEMDSIMAEFAAALKAGKTPASAEVQALVKKLQNHITGNYYHCTDEILSGLGRMYVSDDRFRKNLDRHTAGTAAFICDAIEVYCGNS